LISQKKRAQVIVINRILFQRPKQASIEQSLGLRQFYFYLKDRHKCLINLIIIDLNR